MIRMVKVENETTGDDHSYNLDGEGNLRKDEGSFRERVLSLHMQL